MCKAVQKVRCNEFLGKGVRGYLRGTSGDRDGDLELSRAVRISNHKAWTISTAS